MGACKDIGRSLLISVNSVFMILGGLVIGFGVWILKSTPFFNTWFFIMDVLAVISVFIIILGSITVFIAFLGFCGAINSKSCMLKSYAWILLIILLLQLSGAIYLGVHSEEILGLNRINDNYKETVWHYKNGANHDVEGVDFIQNTFKCCGYDTPQDIRFRNGSYPWSCCDSDDLLIQVLNVCTTSHYEPGCFGVLKTFAIKSIITYGFFTLFQITCISVAFYLSYIPKKRMYNSKYQRMS